MRFDSWDEDPFFPTFFFFPRKSDESTRGSPPGNPFLRHACNSVVPVENRSSAFLPSEWPTITMRSSHHRCHLQWGISIFSIRSNLIDAVHCTPAFARRINNVAVHNTRTMAVSEDVAIETRYETRRLHISWELSRCRDDAITIMICITVVKTEI